MSTRSRSPRVLSGLLVATLVASVAPTSEAQQPPLRPGQTPGPRFVMPTLKGEGDGPLLGFQVARAVRERIASDFDMRALWVVPESTITAYLVSAGYPADQSLTTEETRQLALSFRAEELLDGVVTRTSAGGYRVRASWGLTGRDDMLQPLPTVEAEKISDVAKLVAKEFQAARKQVESVQRCITLARARNYTAALAEARKAIDAYPASVLGRVCIANIYDQEKLGPDSMIRISSEILAIHPENVRALAFAADAYGAKGLADDQHRMLDQLVRVEPTNHRGRLALINLLASRGDLDRAKAHADTLVTLEPGDASALATQWRVYLAAKAWARAVDIGEQLLDADSSAATREFFVRMIAAADAEGRPEKALDLATRGVGRFPTDDELAALRAQYLRRGGQLAQARAVLKGVVERNPHAPNAWSQLARVEAELGLGADTVLATLGRGIASGDDRATVALYARALGVAATRDSVPNKFDALRTGLRYFKFSASAQPGDTTSFLIGTTSVALGLRLATEPPAAKRCELAKEMQALAIDAQIELPKGGRAFPKEVRTTWRAPPSLARTPTSWRSRSVVERGNDVADQRGQDNCPDPFDGAAQHIPANRPIGGIA